MLVLTGAPVAGVLELSVPEMLPSPKVPVRLCPKHTVTLVSAMAQKRDSPPDSTFHREEPAGFGTGPFGTFRVVGLL